MKKIICLGGQGDPISIGKAIIDSNLRGDHKFEFSGLLNDSLKVGTSIDGFTILGKLKDAEYFVNQGYYFINAILRIDGNPLRIKLVEDLNIPSDRMATFVHPTAYVAPGVKFGPGCVVMPNVYVGQETMLGKGCIILHGATIGHNCSLGDYCHVSAQACLAGYLRVGKGVHFGLNSSIRENVTIGDFSSIGMGAVLLKNIGDYEIWAGIPAKFLRKPKD